MPIQTLARPDVVQASPDATLTELAQLMRDEQVGSVVIANDRTPVGIVTDRDLTTRVLANEGASDGMLAEDVMSQELCTVPEDTGLYEAARVMSENGVRRLPICDADGALSGIITVDDVIELLADEHQQLASIIEAQRAPY